MKTKNQLRKELLNFHSSFISHGFTPTYLPTTNDHKYNQMLEQIINKATKELKKLKNAQAKALKRRPAPKPKAQRTLIFNKAIIKARKAINKTINKTNGHKN